MKRHYNIKHPELKNSLIKRKGKKYSIKKVSKKDFSGAVNEMYNKTYYLGYWNKYQRIRSKVYLSSIIKFTIKNGNICKTYSLVRTLAKAVKKKYKINFYRFMSRVYRNALPIVGFRNWHLGKIKYKVPYFNLNEKKNIRIATNWFNSSVKRNRRNKKKLCVRFMDEAIGIYKRDPNCETIKKKKRYHLDFIKGRNAIRFLKHFTLSKKPGRVY
jgi:ribosomal protein S7